MMKSDIAIYVATHSEYYKDNSGYIYSIQVGAAESKKNLSKIKDDDGINISVKNKNYCELTALYWIWKNSNYSIVGLEHYRRHFIISLHTIMELLNKYDCIIPKAYYFRVSLSAEYCSVHEKNDWDILLNILRQKYPNKKEEIDSVFQSNKLYPYNMLIAKKEQLDKYCSWLFPILFDLEKQIDLSSKNNYQKRIFGFISERLFTLYLVLEDITYYECEVTLPEKQNFILRLKFMIGLYFNRVYFKLKCKDA